ncbi:MAG: hypothetical protein AYK23_04780 [Candidatus Proteinoplasmatales archaeon SG8-5]|nr:MAG: hypothetical protein AYK23_04780 [Candidatus Proteinoplasmatales archaeon SG8-5]
MAIAILPVLPKMLADAQCRFSAHILSTLLILWKKKEWEHWDFHTGAADGSAASRNIMQVSRLALPTSSQTASIAAQSSLVANDTRSELRVIF